LNYRMAAAKAAGRPSPDRRRSDCRAGLADPIEIASAARRSMAPASCSTASMRRPASGLHRGVPLRAWCGAAASAAVARRRGGRRRSRSGVYATLSRSTSLISRALGAPRCPLGWRSAPSMHAASRRSAAGRLPLANVRARLLWMWRGGIRKHPGQTDRAAITGKLTVNLAHRAASTSDG